MKNDTELEFEWIQAFIDLDNKQLSKEEFKTKIKGLIKQDQEKANEKQLLIDLLKHSAGYSINLEGYLEIRSYGPMAGDDCGKFGVEEWPPYEEPGPNAGNYPNCPNYPTEETIYDTVEEAVDKFLEIRYRRELGLDFWK